MRNKQLSALLTGLVLFVGLSHSAYAALIPFDLDITSTSENQSFGSGVSIGDEFQGRFFVEANDIVADGMVDIQGTTGSLMVAGIDFGPLFDSVLSGRFLIFSGGAPVCIDSASADCLASTTVMSSSPGFSLRLTDDVTGVNNENKFGLTGAGEFNFSYSISAAQVSEPGILGLFGLSLLGLAMSGRKLRR